MTKEAVRSLGIASEDVSHETSEKIKTYLQLLMHWNQSISLVSAQHEIWDRHVLDSVQLKNYINRSDLVADLGSGNGFPGIILAITTENKIDLYEVNQKKASFLRYISSQLNLSLNIFSDFEKVEKKYDVMTIRAVDKLKNILRKTSLLRTENTRYLFLKGESFQKELEEALLDFNFSFTIYPSKSKKEGAVIEIWNVVE